MALIAFPVPGKEKSRVLCEAFVAGAPRDAVGSVFYGVKEGNHADWLRVKAKGHDFYFIDNSYFDGASRGVQFRVAKNRLQHTGLGESDGKRFAALGIEIQPWRDLRERDTIIFSPQSDDHMHLTVGYKGDWLKDALRAFESSTRTKVVRHWSPDKIKAQRSLPEELKRACGLVTHTSASAITALLAGVPVFCDPQCTATYGGSDDYDVRLRWAGVLADNQFSLDELRSGYAWRTLNP